MNSIKRFTAILLIMFVITFGFTYRTYKELKELRQYVSIQEIRITNLQEKTPIITPTQTYVQKPLIDLGEFTISHYCSCKSCCGKSDGITASGTVATPERTVAVDSNVIPIGTVLYINGIYYIAEDTGGAIKGNRIDIFCSTHEEALQKGIYNTVVYEVVE